MSILGHILTKIIGTAESGRAPNAAAAPSSDSGTAQPAATAPKISEGAAHPAAATPMGEVDVEAILAKMAEQRGGESLNARKELAQELDVHAGSDGSAEQNIALHHAVMAKLEENGGKVPASLKG